MQSTSADPIPDEMRQRLDEAWQRHSRDLMQRNGSSARHERGGDNIAGNPLLQDALNHIFKAYVPLLYTKHKLSPSVGQSATKQGSETQSAIDRLVAERTREAYQALQQQNYGQIAPKAAAIPGLDPETAHRILGSVILRTIRSFRDTLGEPQLSIPLKVIESPREGVAVGG